MTRGPGVAGWIAIGCAIFVIAGASFVAAIVLVVFGALRASDPYKDSLRRAQADPRVIAALGSPIEPGFWMTGSIQVENDEGTVNMEYTIKGPKKGARLRVAGTKERGRWYYQQMVVAPKDAADIDLLISSERSTSTAPRGD